MTPNLTSARQAIQAELSHARQGVAFYSARVEALESALTQLESVEGDETAPVKKGRGKTTAGNRQKSQESRPGRKTRMRKENGSSDASATGAAQAREEKNRGGKRRSAAPSGKSGSLPTTGTDFWLELVTESPKSAVDIANAAVEKLGVKPDQKELIQKLKQRVAPALSTLVSTRKIQDTGAGRERRFFREEGHSA